MKNYINLQRIKILCRQRTYITQNRTILVISALVATFVLALTALSSSPVGLIKSAIINIPLSVLSLIIYILLYKTTPKEEPEIEDTLTIIKYHVAVFMFIIFFGTLPAYVYVLPLKIDALFFLAFIMPHISTYVLLKKEQAKIKKRAQLTLS